MSKICWVSCKQCRLRIRHSVASDLGVHCLLRPVCPNTYGKYCTYLPNVSVPIKRDIESTHSSLYIPKDISGKYSFIIAVYPQSDSKRVLIHISVVFNKYCLDILGLMYPEFQFTVQALPLLFSNICVRVSNDSISRQRRPLSDCTDAQADLGLHCLQKLWRHLFPW